MDQLILLWGSSKKNLPDLRSVFINTGKRSVPDLPVGPFKGTCAYQNVHGKEERLLFFT